MSSRPINAITVNGRHRQNLGDLTSLCESIEKVGLLHPIVVTEGGQLIAGQRRLEACRQLGWTEIPVTVADNLTDAVHLLWAERDENTCRLSMTPSEKVALGRELEKLERSKAKARQSAAGANFGRGIASDKSPEAIPSGDARDAVGAGLGMAGVTYERARAVVDAAEAGDATAQEALVKMDRTGKIEPAYKAVFPNGKPRTRQAPPSPDTGRAQTISSAACRRLDKVLAQIDGFAIGLADFDVSPALQTAEPAQVEGWIKSATHGISALRQLRDRLKETV